MKTIIYSASILLLQTLLLSSCNNGGGGTSAPAKSLEEQLGEANSVTDYSKTILPENYRIVKANLSYDEMKEKYTVGCKTQGEPSSNGVQIDPGLQVGHTFVKKEGGGELLSRNSSQTQEAKISEISGQKIKTEFNFSEVDLQGSPFNSIDEIFVSKPHVVTDVTYTNNGIGDFNFVANWTTAARQYMEANRQTGGRIWCHISNGDYKSTVDKVIYALNGHQVTAFVDKSSSAGEVICEKYSSEGKAIEPKVNLGKGRSEEVRITTNNIISESAISCGGIEIFDMEKIVLDSGKIVKSEVRKTLSAPLR